MFDVVLRYFFFGFAFLLILLTGCQKDADEKADEATGPLIELLERGTDRTLGDELVLSPDGSIDRYPTLRCVLLEELVESSPASSVEYANRLICGKQCPPPGEFAICIRALAKEPDPSERQKYFNRAAEVFVSKEEWFRDPNRAVLECFDLFAHCDSPHILQELDRISQSDFPHSVRFACEVAVHRIALAEEHPMRTLLKNDQTLWGNREVWRGKVFAHTNIGIQEQAESFLDYLRSGRYSAEEMEIIVASFPAAIFNGTGGLISKGVMPAPAEVSKRDLATLIWLKSNQDEVVGGNKKEAMGRVIERLEVVVEQAKRAGLLEQ